MASSLDDKKISIGLFAKGMFKTSCKKYKRQDGVDDNAAAATGGDQCNLNLVEWTGDGTGDLTQMIATSETKLFRKGTLFFMKTWTSDLTSQTISFGEITQELEILKQPNPHVVYYKNNSFFLLFYALFLILKISKVANCLFCESGTITNYNGICNR